MARFPALPVLLVLACRLVAGLNLKVGFMPSFANDGDVPGGTFLFRKAIQQLKEEGLLPEDVQLEQVYSPACAYGTATTFAAELYHNYSDLAGIVGAPCTSGTTLLGHMMADWNLPLVVNLAKGPELADKELFTTTARVAEHGSSLGPSMLEFLEHQGWSEFGWMTDPNRAALLSDSMDLALKRNRRVKANTKQIISLKADSTCDEAEVDAALDVLKATSRIIVLAFDSWHTVGQPEIAARQILFQAEKKGMTGPDFVYVVPLGSANLMPPTGVDHLPKLLDNSSAAFRQTIVQLPVSRSDTQLAEAVQLFGEWTHAPGAEQLYPGIAQVAEAKNWNVSLMMLNYDAAYLYGKALGACLNETNFPPKDRSPCDWRDGRRMMELIRFIQFDGLSGPILMNGYFEREVAYFLYALDPDTGLKTRFWGQEVEVVTVDGYKKARRRTSANRTFQWATEDGLPPPAVPKCGFVGDLCPSWLSRNAMPVTAGVVILGFALVVVAYQIRKRQLENAVLSKSWEIPAYQIKMQGRRVSQSHSALSVSQSHSALSVVSVAAADPATIIGYVGQASWANRRVALKQYPTTELISVRKRETLTLLKELKDLQHTNLATFYGLCLDNKDKIQVLWELCSKGSLADVVFGSGLTLDSTLRGSIARDVVHGLDFLHHTPIACHGQLTSENCLVDSRWTVKLTDFGLSEILRPHIVRGQLRFKEFSADKLMHTAPEVLSTWTKAHGCSARATPEADIYSLGMILYQLITGDQLLTATGVAEETIVQDVLSGKKKFYRPPVPTKPQDDEGGEVANVLLPLMRKCWEEEAAGRPKASQVKKSINRLASSRVSLVEHMMSAMERYAANLERTVAA